jgi:hypothetical protein
MHTDHKYHMHTCVHTCIQIMYTQGLIDSYKPLVHPITLQPRSALISMITSFLCSYNHTQC